jgi:hypothetical protein
MSDTETCLSCLSCKFAKWQRTQAGRLHPSGGGRCGWAMPHIPIPAAFYWLGHRENNQPQPSGGYIKRHEPRRNCPTWESAP